MKDFERASKIVKLLIAELNQSLSEEEQTILNEWIRENNDNELLYKSLSDQSNIPGKLKRLSNYNVEKAYAIFKEQTQISKTIPLTRRILRYVAILIPLIIASFFTYQRFIKVEPETQLTELEIDHQPGSSKAILVLADGNIVILEEEEEIKTESEDIEISNNKREIIYSSSKKGIRAQKLSFNTLKIPRGGEYQLSLSDGTKIWLNSESEIKYPIRFSNKKREVFLKGEAFFEVAENQDVPFIVNASDISVNVLGTSFNVRAYSDESQIRTTLVTGKVMFRDTETEKEIHLMPNEQAVTTSHETVVRSVDVNQYIAWKDGRILFEENTVEEIFNDLSRWYDIDIEYTNQEIQDLRYSIDIERYENLSEILEIFELTGKLRFKVEENKLSIMEN